MKLVVVKIIFGVLLVPNKRVFRIPVNYVNLPSIRDNLPKLNLEQLPTLNLGGSAYPRSSKPQADWLLVSVIDYRLVY